MKFKLTFSLLVSILAMLLLSGACHRAVGPQIEPIQDHSGDVWNLSLVYIRRYESITNNIVFPAPTDPGVSIERLSEDRYRVNGWLTVTGPDSYRLGWSLVAEYQGNDTWRFRDFSKRLL